MSVTWPAVVGISTSVRPSWTYQAQSPGGHWRKQHSKVNRFVCRQCCVKTSELNKLQNSHPQPPVPTQSAAPLQGAKSRHHRSRASEAPKSRHHRSKSAAKQRRNQGAGGHTVRALLEHCKTLVKQSHWSPAVLQRCSRSHGEVHQSSSTCQ